MDVIKLYHDIADVEFVVSNMNVECLVRLFDGRSAKGESLLETRTNVFGYDVVDMKACKADAIENALHKFVVSTAR